MSLSVPNNFTRASVGAYSKNSKSEDGAKATSGFNKATQSVGSQASELSKADEMDQAVISQEGRESALQDADLSSRLGKTLQDGDFSELAELLPKDKNSLEVNWDRMVDPDGRIAAATYAESLVTQYDKARVTIEAYYADAHKENMSFDDPYNHILSKYKDDLFPHSPYFRSDMSESERLMSFEQERAMLWGGQLTLKDPYALKASGGVLNTKDVDKIAQQAVRDKLDALRQEMERSDSGNAAFDAKA